MPISGIPNSPSSQRLIGALPLLAPRQSDCISVHQSYGCSRCRSNWHRLWLCLWLALQQLMLKSAAAVGKGTETRNEKTLRKRAVFKPTHRHNGTSFSCRTRLESVESVHSTHTVAMLMWPACRSNGFQLFQLRFMVSAGVVVARRNRAPP